MEHQIVYRHQTSVRRWRWWLALIALVALLLGVHTVSAGYKVWSTVTLTPDPCHDLGLVCAEIVDAEGTLVCCVEPSTIGTSNRDACILLDNRF